MSHTYEESRQTTDRIVHAWESGKHIELSDREREIVRERAAADPLVSEMLRDIAAGITPEAE